MAIVRDQEAFSFTPRCTYDVFLSFGGEDTRKTFNDHLYEALSVGAGLHTFRDDEGIERRENVDSELEKVITASRSSIIVFSKDYASSKCCLDELVMIIEHKRTSEHVILPVFFDVVPSQVRHQTGSFAEAFGRHEVLFKMETDERKREYWRNKVEGWRTTLREVANLAGMDLRNDANGFESILIKKIIKEIGRKLNRPVLHVAPYLIGMEYRAGNINLWLRNESAGDGIVMICGIGGIGKTTIAKYVYNLNFKRFDSSSFLANIRETSAQYNGLVCLQWQLLSNIFRREEKNISNVDEGIIRIEHALRCKKVLVVLDDVDQQYQLDSLIGMHKQFHPGSKIIVTARNKNVLKRNEVYKIYEVKNFNDEESLELFSWHAFGRDHPQEEYYQHSEKVVRHCGGLPLALQVLGSSLFGKNIAIWESALQKLAVIPNSQILQKLKISYDSLEDDDTKRLFLYIAGFFIGEGKDFAVKILDSCGFFTLIGMENLIDRCLLTIDEPEKLCMHQLLQDLAKEIVRQESPKEPGKRSLLLHHEDSFNVLTNKSGTKIIEGLYLDIHVLENSGWFNRTFGTRDTKRPRFEEHNGVSLLADQGNSLKRRCLSFIHWFPIKNASRSSNWIELKMDTFSGMPKLKLLKFNSVEIEGGFNDFPKELRFLSWHQFPLNSIPSDFPLQSLVALDLSHSKLEHVWKGAELPTLKILNLSHCHGLICIPNFTVFPNLEDLILEDCVNMVEVHESIGGLKELVSLNLKGCKNLKNLPREIHCLTSLVKLYIPGCSKLDLSAEEEKMKSLTVRQADGITINRTRTSFWVDSWSFLFKPFVLSPRKTPEPICCSLTTLPCSLVTLSLVDCNFSNDDLARSLGSLSLLQDLNLSGNTIYNLPESIKFLTKLKSLKLFGCDRLQSLPELPMSLGLLDLTYCRSLEMVTNLPNLCTYLNLSSFGCESLVEAERMFKLEPIGNIDLEIIENLGLADHLLSMGSHQVTFFNHLSCEAIKSPIQGVSEFGIYSLFLPRSLVPSWCSNYKKSGSIIEFNVPSDRNLKILALKVHVLYAYAGDEGYLDWERRRLSIFSHGRFLHSEDDSAAFYSYCDDWGWDAIIITNKSKGLSWDYNPTWKCFPDGNQDWLWLSHWKIGHQYLMEGGDEMKICAHVTELYQIKEVGVEIVWDEDEEEGNQHHNIYPSRDNGIDVVDLKPYLQGPGDYFLCHYYREPYQEYKKLQGQRTTQVREIQEQEMT